MASSHERVGASWRTLGELPGSRSVRRWRGAADDGSPVEVLRPQTTGAAAPGAIRAAFARAHRAARDGTDPALARVIEIVEESSSVAVVREPLSEGTLADVSDPLPGHLIAAIGARLLPAVLEIGGALGGTLLPQDVGLDDRGWVVLAPLGPHASAAERSVAGAAAPESFEGAPPDGRAALFGLGALLYRLATGRTPPTGTAPTAPSTWNHRVSPEVDRAILRLLDPDPGKRPAALAELLGAAGAPEDLRPLTHRASTEAQPAVPVLRRSSAGLPLVLPHATLAGLDPSRRSAAAGLAGVPLAAVDELIRAGLPLVIDRQTSRTALEERADQAERALGERAIAPRPPALGPVPWALAAAIAGALPTTLGLALIPLVGWLALVPGMFVGAAGAGLGLWRAGLAAAAQRVAADAETAWSLQERGRGVRQQWASVAAVDQRIARLRTDLAQADLPAAADSDVRSALKEIEGRLDAMIAVLQTAERALASVDRTQLGTRLRTLEGSGQPGHQDAAEQVARTAADLADIEARRDRQLAEVHQLEASLDDLAAALAEPVHADGSSERALLQRTAGLLRGREPER